MEYLHLKKLITDMAMIRIKHLSKNIKMEQEQDSTLIKLIHLAIRGKNIRLLLKITVKKEQALNLIDPLIII